MWLLSLLQEIRKSLILPHFLHFFRLVIGRDTQLLHARTKAKLFEDHASIFLRHITLIKAEPGPKTLRLIILNCINQAIPANRAPGTNLTSYILLRIDSVWNVPTFEDVVPGGHE